MRSPFVLDFPELELFVLLEIKLDVLFVFPSSSLRTSRRLQGLPLNHPQDTNLRLTETGRQASHLAAVGACLLTEPSKRNVEFHDMIIPFRKALCTLNMSIGVN
ncbi:hypothetical protein K523DRAFT_345130 [Schizophyllum commune Tattone D]|nr:hypothetical protein K523DRAFT_345130 [Schizophyllum commune Tattone D]